VANISTTVIVDLVDKITVIAGPILAMMTGIDVIITATITAMTEVTTTVAMTATTGVTTTKVIVVMIATTTSAMTDEMTDVMIDDTRTTTITTTTTGKNELHRHHPKGATPMAHFRRPTTRSTSSSAVAKRSKATDRTDQTLGRSGTSTLKTHGLCVGLNSQSHSPRKIIGFTSLTPGLTRWSLTP
jgi:hypothetical protein